EPHRIGITRERLRTPKLAPGAPLRIAHLSDLHVERNTGRERQLVELIARERPDLIAYSGDLLSYSYTDDPEAWSAAGGAMDRLTPRLGVSGGGGGRPADRHDALGRILEGLPVRWLRDERVTVEHQGQVIDVIGLDCTHRPFLERPRLEALCSRSPER